MFCVNCGARVGEEASFCISCGNRIHRAPAAAPPPPPSSPPPPSPAPLSAHPHPLQAAQPSPGHAQTKCSWCGAAVEASQRSCPMCGATLNTAVAVTRSGWAQLPGRKDMAKLQFGNSVCQIEGNYVPVADMNLAPGDGVYFAHHVLLWKDARVTVSAMSLKGAWKRMFAGLPLVMTQAVGPGHIAFSKDDPGELIAMPLQPGQAVDVREHLFLAAMLHVTYDWFATNIWFTTKSGDDTETHYPVGMNMDRFYAPQTPGLLLLHAGGNVFVRELQRGQTILVKPSALVFKDPTVQMHLHFEHPSTGFSIWGSWSNRYMWLRLSGPGRVAIQSVFERIEGESRNITNFSYATNQQW
ncbi:MAG TPA: AIM24 family protein [Bryobacteraceae bacterium]|nr:AIM24 family protein [Bryobacteraceae bacterium]